MLSIQLINQKKFDSSLFIYKKLVQPVSECGYGKDLIRHMVKTKAVTKKIYTLFAINSEFVFQPVSKVIEVVTDLKDSNLNQLAFENAAEVALITEDLDLAWCLLKKFTYLRPHFFRPILLSTGRSDGELGTN